VHRNGRDSQGNRLEVFTKEYVQETADMMKAMVSKVETKVYATDMTTLFRSECRRAPVTCGAIRSADLRGAGRTAADIGRTGTAVPRTCPIPAKKMKMSRSHRVPLASQALAILRELQKSLANQDISSRR
jgi:integrase